MSADLKALAEAVISARPNEINVPVNRLVDAALSHRCAEHYSEPAETNRADNAELERDEAREARTLLRGALEALVTGIEDVVVRFVESKQMHLRADLRILLFARLERAHIALKETAP